MKKIADMSAEELAGLVREALLKAGITTTLSGGVLIGLLASVPATAEEMDDAYWQLAASLPIVQTSSIDKGHPWRLMFGYPLVRRDRLTLHQDWVVSYLDAEPRADSPGGHGAAFGTDLSLQWRHRRGIALTPHYEIGGGIQYAAGTAFPAHGGRWMFTLNAAVGLLIPRNDRQLDAAVRWQHISNAGVFPKNAGYDAIHLVLGIPVLLAWLGPVGC